MNNIDKKIAELKMHQRMEKERIAKEENEPKKTPKIKKVKLSEEELQERSGLIKNKTEEFREKYKSI